MSTLTGKPYHAVLWFRYGPHLASCRRQYTRTAFTGGGATNATIATAIKDLTALTLVPLLHQSAYFEGVALYDDETSLITPAALSAHVHLQGTRGVTPLPAAACGFLRFVAIGDNGDARTGRLFVPFPSQTDNTAGIPTTSYFAALQAAGNAWLSVLQLDGTHPGPPPVAYTTTLKPTIRTPGDTSGFEVLFVRAFRAWATQRRRNRVPSRVVCPFPPP